MDHERKFPLFPLDTNVIEKKEDLVKVRLKVKDKDEFIPWLKADYRCQHNTNPRSDNPSKKHTNCPVAMSVTVKRAIKRCRSKDPYMPEYPTTVIIRGSHNHRIPAVSAMKSRDPTRQKSLRVTKKSHKKSLAVTENTTAEETPYIAEETPYNMDCNEEDNCTSSVLEREKVESDLLAFFREGYEADPTGFLAPMAAFIKSARSMKTKSDLYSALRSFGKADKSRLSAGRKATKISVQTIARSPESCVWSGRPSKSPRTSEHANASQLARRALFPAEENTNPLTNFLTEIGLELSVNTTIL